MRPTDKEIEEKFYTMSTEKAGSEQDRAQWEQANRERLKQQEAAKWARDFDPWYYIEDLTNEFIRQNFVDKHFLVKTFNNEYCTGVLANNSHGGIGKFLVAFANEKELFFDDIYAFLPLNEIKPKR